jgi:hypothetical protein
LAALAGGVAVRQNGVARPCLRPHSNKVLRQRRVRVIKHGLRLSRTADDLVGGSE